MPLSILILRQGKHLPAASGQWGRKGIPSPALFPFIHSLVQGLSCFVSDVHLCPENWIEFLNGILLPQPSTTVIYQTSLAFWVHGSA